MVAAILAMPDEEKNDWLLRLVEGEAGLAESFSAHLAGEPPTREDPPPSASTREVLAGRWRITWMEMWDQDATDLLGPAFIELNPDGSGRFRFIVVTGSFRYPVGPNHFLVDWVGSDECDPAWGELDVELKDQKLVGSIELAHGDESEFIARRWDTDTDGEP